MTEARSEGAIASERVASVVWGLLLIWTGLSALLQWGWGVGLLGAGVILLGAQLARARGGLKVDVFGLMAGVVLVLCGLGNLTHVPIQIVPVICIVAGVALLASTWTARRRAASGGRELPPEPHPRA